MLPAFEAIPRAVRLQADEANGGIEFAQPTGRADESTAGAERRDKMSYFPAGLLPDLGRRCAVMRLPICGIAVLVGIEVCPGICGNEFAHTANRAIRALIARRHYQFCAIRNKNAFALMRCAARQVELYGIPECRADHRVGDTGVPACCVDEGLAGRELAARQPRSNHAQCSAILY